MQIRPIMIRLDYEQKTPKKSRWKAFWLMVAVASSLIPFIA